MRSIDLSGEEHFGPLSARLYSMLCRPGWNTVYRFAVDDILSSRSSGTLLDVGTGPGTLPAILYYNAYSLQIYAVDPSLSMLKIARKRLSGTEVRVAWGYSMYIPFKARYDLIVSSLSFHHWAHQRESLTYLSRFLKRDGEIRIYEFRKSRASGILRFVRRAHSMDGRELRSAAKGSRVKFNGLAEDGEVIRASYSLS
ncbi:MAG: class I SAM-dependent methyltransferase [Candidatus Marsarchaeota archaeon]|jgi:ubiquinone/menaquinone biosynthesis C-methylase UbiE|nr:class I SAM-dependent methyltransferase [Candidatus Marsarchaeota archaeon]